MNTDCLFSPIHSTPKRNDSSINQSSELDLILESIDSNLSQLNSTIFPVHGSHSETSLFNTIIHEPHSDSDTDTGGFESNSFNMHEVRDIIEITALRSRLKEEIQKTESIFLELEELRSANRRICAENLDLKANSIQLQKDLSDLSLQYDREKVFLMDQNAALRAQREDMDGLLQAKSQELKEAVRTMGLLQDDLTRISLEKKKGGFKPPKKAVNIPVDSSRNTKTVVNKGTPSLSPAPTKPPVLSPNSHSNPTASPISVSNNPSRQPASVSGVIKHGINNESQVASKVIKIIIVGDSQARNIGNLIREKLNSGSNKGKFDVTSSCRPNATFNQVLSDLEGLTKDYTKNDFVLLMGGSNDIPQAKLDKYDEILDKIVRVAGRTNVVVSEVPYRYDLNNFKSSKENAKFINRLLSSTMRHTNSFKVLKLAFLKRHHFTSHGLHYSYKGKCLLVSKFMSLIKSVNFL